MRFLTRGLTGLILMVLTLGLLASAAVMLRNAVAERMASQGTGPGGRERVFAANVVALEFATEVPRLTAYGQIRSTRRLELRARAAGTIAALAPEFQDGAFVTAGTVLAEIDPAQARAVRDQARAALREAEAGLAQAERALVIAGDDLEAARAQADLRQRALDRQISLNERGLGSAVTTESAELDASSAAQAVLTRRSSLSSAQATRDQAEAVLLRAQVDLSEAERELAETRIVAEYDGYLASVAAVRGGVVSANEMLAELIDPQSLEVSFRVSTQQFARFLDPQARLVPAEAEVRLDTAGGQVRTRAHLVRVSGAVEEGATGRLLFAALDAAAGFLPGDFVTVELFEPALENVARVSARAVGASGTVLRLDDDSRLRETPVEVLRREGDTVLIRADLPQGTEIVEQRTPLLGEGIRLRPMRPEGAASEALNGAGATQDRAEAPAPAASQTENLAANQMADQMVPIDADRRARLLAAVEASARMPEQVKAQLMRELQGDTVSQATLARLENRIGG